MLNIQILLHRMLLNINREYISNNADFGLVHFDHFMIVSKIVFPKDLKNVFSHYLDFLRFFIS